MKIYQESIDISSKNQPPVKQAPNKNISFIASGQLEDELIEACNKLGITKSLFIRSLIVSYINEDKSI
jgi:hypothetical protein